ncbi:ATP-dependent Clp protease adapter ClpS [Pleionea sp. CnH1-48]|uniref:ATP-dependent Clp protease adapter ClpS n=1 Tax=Pleionea sp. CnH1-48 TaxID=2954494 RepID=UPI0021134F26|nr:ATP-dependent Clp protease adapter ClpS [Pleionea sp. CnH1-48]
MSHENESDWDIDHGVATQESEPEVKPPPMYKVVLLNDDFTPMDFVVEVLMKFFGKHKEQATKVMLQIHYEGKGICGVFRSEIAEMKVMQVNEFSRTNQHPLLCIMEEE